jgi:hypothetical protein
MVHYSILGAIRWLHPHRRASAAGDRGADESWRNLCRSFVRDVLQPVGWALLGLLLLMFLPPVSPRPHQRLLDASSAAVLVLLMLYTKISYGGVAIGFLFFMLLDPRQRNWASDRAGSRLGNGAPRRGILAAVRPPSGGYHAGRRSERGQCAAR